MDEKTIEKRKAELSAQAEQVKVQYQALVGAIQDCNYWLEQIKPKEKSKEK